MLNLTTEIASSLGNKRVVVFALAETLLIFGLFAFIIFRKPVAPLIIPKDTEKQWKDSIQKLNIQYENYSSKIKTLLIQNDSLVNLKTNIQIVYDTKIKYIEHAPLDTTVSFIRNFLKSSD